MRAKKQGKLSFKTGWTRWWPFLTRAFRLGWGGLTRLLVRRRFLVGVGSFLLLVAVGWTIGRRLSPVVTSPPLTVADRAGAVDKKAPDYAAVLQERQADPAVLRSQLPAEEADRTAPAVDAGPVFTPRQLAPPVAGKVIKRSGWEKKDGAWRYHAGVDFSVPPGTPVVAAAAGRVVAVRTEAALGTVVVIEHGNDWQSLYGQLTGIQVVPGQEVARGALLGYSSRAGCGPAPGVHFNLYYRDDPVDPSTVLNLAQE
ncbi:MAG: M23 family metallopeptidase [Firmicutes bacterium]|nr:M23 family metallopeptidase [Bacillota bacterium]